MLHMVHCEDSFLEDSDSSGRQFQLQNVSLVITYSGIVVAALMMAGFLYIAANFGRRRSGYGYYAEDDYYDGYHYQRSIRNKGMLFKMIRNHINNHNNCHISDIPEFLSEMFSQLTSHDQEEEEDWEEMFFDKYVQ